MSGRALRICCARRRIGRRFCVASARLMRGSCATWASAGRARSTSAWKTASAVVRPCAMRESDLPVSLSEVSLNCTTATAAMGTITMIVKKMKSRPRNDIGPPMYRQTRSLAFALQAAYLLHEVWPVLLQVVRSECLAAEERGSAHVPDHHQRGSGQQRYRSDHEHAAQSEQRGEAVVIGDRILAVAN